MMRTDFSFVLLYFGGLRMRNGECELMKIVRDDSLRMGMTISSSDIIIVCGIFVFINTDHW